MSTMIKWFRTSRLSIKNSLSEQLKERRKQEKYAYERWAKDGLGRA